ncbi:MAG: amino acid ABC transporter permease [Verrucomicrobiota bacterium]|nr:amino acid ABC transporter permease [Verrucomicrobiota bacterium]
MLIDFPLICDSLPALLRGVTVSLGITAVATFLGISLGTLFGIVLTGKSRSLRYVITGYVTLFRGTPMLVQILFVYYALPQFGIMIAPFWAAGLAIGLNSCAYVSQIVQSGIEAVPNGQVEAAKTLGLSSLQTLLYIVLPQAFRTILPVLGNEAITLIKDSSLASIIGVMELSKEASIIRSTTYDAFSILLAISLIYLLLTGGVSLLFKKLENRRKKYAPGT